MSKKWVGRFLGIAVVFNIVAIALMAVVMFGGDVVLRTGNAYLFLPWLPMGLLGLPLLVAVVVLSLGVGVWRSRVSAVLLLVVYVVSKVLLVSWMYVLGQSGRVLWFAVTVFWALCLATGVIGTFGYHRLPTAERTPRSRTATIVGIAVSSVLIVVLLAVTALNTASRSEAHTIEFLATSSGDAHVRFSSKNFGEAEADFTQSWSKEITVQGSQDLIMLDVTAIGNTQSTVSCTILWDGEILDQREHSGVLATVSCLAEPE